MIDMPGDGSDIASAGRRLRIKVLLALTLASGGPILVLVYVTRGWVLPALAADPTADRGLLQALLIFTVLGVLAGAYIIWDIGGTVARMAQMMANEQAISGLDRRKDEVGTLMGSFNKMLGTIEQQAAEIKRCAGTHFDPAVVEAFLQVPETLLEEIRRRSIEP